MGKVKEKCSGGDSEQAPMGQIPRGSAPRSQTPHGRRSAGFGLIWEQQATGLILLQIDD